MMSSVVDAAIPPAAVDALADRLNEKASEAIALRRQGDHLGVGAIMGSLNAVIAWAEGAARQLHTAADIARSGARGPSPFEVLAEYKLPTSFGAVGPEQGTSTLAALQAVLDGVNAETPEQRADAVRKYFAGLSPEMQSWLVVNAADTVGGLDGAPTTMRYAANRILIQRAFDAETAAFAAMKPDPNNAHWQQSRDRLKRYQEFLRVDKRTTHLPDGSAVTVTKGRQFLFFDPAGDGKIAEVVGDLDTAKNVSVMVPGITNRLDNFDERVRDGAGNHEPAGQLRRHRRRRPGPVQICGRPRARPDRGRSVAGLRHPPVR
jgi:hypothetical protein